MRNCSFLVLQTPQSPPRSDLVLVGDPHGEVEHRERVSPSPSDVAHHPQDVAPLGLRHHRVVGHLHHLGLQGAVRGQGRVLLPAGDEVHRVTRQVYY